MRVIVCGSRTYGIVGPKLDSQVDYEIDTMFSFLDGAFAYIEDPGVGPVAGEDLTILQGGAKGADRLASDWAATRSARQILFIADWARYPNAAGPIRNKAMLDSGCDQVVAFVDKPLYESKGTNNMVRQARDAGVRTIVIEVTPSAVTSRQQSSPQLFSA